jgi:small subunit ribosomal protein S2
MKPYIFTERNGIHIINLQVTAKAMDEAYGLVRDVASQGGNILFVGTKRQAQETIQVEATRCGMPYVTARWLGGFLTNWRTIRERINELDRLERMRDRGDFERITKKEGLMITRKIDKLETRLGGIRKMVQLPDLLFVVDVRREETAIHEANLLNIPVVAMVDTNCDPRKVDYVIPSNDDAIRAIKLIVSKVADAVVEGRARHAEDQGDEMSDTSFAAPSTETAQTTMQAEEPELADEDLLGAATLAKLQSAKEEAAESDEKVEAEVEEVEEVVETEATVEAETVEVVEETDDTEEAEESSEEAETDEK